MNKNTELALNIAGAVKEAGGRCYYVGGYVRDKLMGIVSGDIDIEVHGITPDTLDKILDFFGHKREMGASFGIWGIDGYDVDIAMPRLEEAFGSHHRDFKTIVDPYIGTEKAAMRRDFTINSILEDVLTGEIIDHFGGVDDIKNNLLRHTNNNSFGEDPLRVLRCAGFTARLGFDVHDDTKKLCSEMNLENLSSERIFAELEKALLKSRKPSLFFDFLRECSHLSVWFQEVKALIGVEQCEIYHAEGDVYNHTMLALDIAANLREKAENPLAFMLAVLCHDLGKAVATTVIDGRIRAFDHENLGVDIADTFISRLTSNKKLKKYVKNMVKLHMRPNMLVKQKAGKKAYNRLFDKSESPKDLLLLSQVDFDASLSNGEKESYEHTKAVLEKALDDYNELMKKPGVTGKDLVDSGLVPSEDFTRLLDYAHMLHLSGVDKKNALAQTLAQYKSGNI